MLGQAFKTKPIGLVLEEAEQGEKLKRSLKLLDIIALGVGVVIGAGIFATVGVAASGSQGYLAAGPAVILSFVLVGIACFFCALCYAEFASIIPIAGSAYTYAYSTLGELIAWMIGWDLVLEYAVGSMAIAISWSAYCNAFLKGFGIYLPLWLITATQSASPEVVAQAPVICNIPIVFNLPALLIVALLTSLLVYGMAESSIVNKIMVFVKLAVIAMVVGVGIFHVDPANWQPFMPNGWAGVQAGAALVFFAYVGFDAVSTAAEEAENPKKDMPVGIMWILGICTLLYISVAAVLTGMLSYTKLNVADPVAFAFHQINMPWVAGLISVGAVASMTTVLLVLLMGQPRIFFSMARDGLLPKLFCKVHPVHQTPFISTILTGCVVAIAASFLDISVVLELCNIGTLFAFVVVCVGVIILRKTQPDLKRTFSTPCVPLFPILGILSCLTLMLAMPFTTWLRFGVWLALGLVVYAFYGFKNSKLQHELILDKTAGNNAVEAESNVPEKTEDTEEQK